MSFYTLILNADKILSYLKKIFFSFPDHRDSFQQENLP